MAENEKDENSLTESQENVEQNDESFDKNTDDKIEIKKPELVNYKQKIDELDTLLEKEKEKSLRLLADYQNLQKQNIDRINLHGDKIISDFLIVYEDLIRAQSVLKLDGIDSIISNMKAILEHYDVKPIETEGRKFDPKLHEVIEEIEDNDHEEGTIVKEITKGYIIRGEVMKYSKVCVSKKLIKK